MRVWEQDLGRCGIRHEKGNGSWGSYGRGFALCGRAGLPYFPCPWPCQSTGDQISKLIARPDMFLTWLEISVASCTSVFAPQDAGVLEASEAMRGHHPESCPRRALQQGESWVDTSRPLGQRVREYTRPLGQVKMALARL